MCDSCHSSSISFGNRSLQAACGADCSHGKSGGCGSRKGRCNNCVTCMAILKDTVSERACCGSGNAHVFAYNVSAVNIPANGNVSFDRVGEHHVIIPPGASGNDATQFKLLHAGTYQYDYYVKGVTRTGSVAGTNPLVFELLGNGTQILGTQYMSQDKSNPVENTFVIGFGIISVPANTTIQLHNLTGGSNDNVDLAAVPTGGIGSALIINASLRIIRTC